MVLDRASKPTERWEATLYSYALVFTAFSRASDQVSPATAFLEIVAPMRLWNPLNAPSSLASLTWRQRQHLRHTLPCVVSCLGVIYLFTGFYLKVEV